MSTQQRQLLLHLSCCLAFLLLPILFSPDFNFTTSLFTIAPFQRDLIAYILLLVFFYVNYIWIIPTYYIQKKYFQFSLISIACFLMIAFLPSLIIPHHQFSSGALPVNNLYGNSNITFHPDNTIMHLLSQHFFQFLMVLIFSLLLKINNQLRESEREKINSELSFLKAQINPHFLFNTLNSLYSTSIEERAYKTQKAILNLSGMMRYIITETDADYISLEKELQYINSYIDLQKLKLTDTIDLDYLLQGSVEKKRIAPLILITFIENAFKHGINPHIKSPINIHIRFTEKYLTLKVENRKTDKIHDYISKTKIGIENTISRLKLLYPHNHQLEITDDKDNYQVKLTMELV